MEIHLLSVDFLHKCPVMRKAYPWASYQIRKIPGCACAGNAGNVFPRRRLQRKPLVSDPGMHHGTCVTHVPWCMSGSLTRGGEENVPGIPGACAPVILRIWQEAYCIIPLCTGKALHGKTVELFVTDHVLFFGPLAIYALRFIRTYEFPHLSGIQDN